MELHDITGSWGRWQAYVFAILFYVNVVGVWQNLSITFMAPNVAFTCTNSTEQCPANCTSWQYENQDTIVSEWDLVCDREWLVSFSKSIYMAGFLISVMFFGQLSDSIGRLKAMIVAYIITVFSMFITLLSSSYIMFVVLRFIQAFGRTGLTTIGFVLITELVGTSHRTKVGIGVQLGWTLGFITLAGVAWIFRNWIWFQLAMSLPILPIMLVYPLVPESPRWLLMKGKMDTLEKTLMRAAEINKNPIKVVTYDLETIRKQKIEESQKTKTVFNLFDTPNLRNRTFNMMFQWMVNALLYYALAFNTNELAGDPYLNFSLAGLLEIPSYALLIVALSRMGRRTTLAGLVLAAGACHFAAAFSPEDWVRWLSQLGKLFVTGSFGLLYLYTSELFPTVVRNAALGSCSMVARVGSIAAPFLKEMGQATAPWAPSALCGALALACGILALLLPETKDREIPDTMQEGEDFDDKATETPTPSNAQGNTTETSQL